MAGSLPYMQLLIGTTNRGKMIEFRRTLDPLGFLIVEPEQLDIHEEPEENGDTFEENALHKARFYFEQSNVPTIADDSGIIVDALRDELGVKTRRWGAGPSASDEEWIRFFLKRMENEQNRTARFVATIAYINADGTQHLFTGSCEGDITESLESDYLPGLPLLGCFRAKGYTDVLHRMDPEEFRQVNHRQQALQQFIEYISHSNTALH